MGGEGILGNRTRFLETTQCSGFRANLGTEEPGRQLSP